MKTKKKISISIDSLLLRKLDSMIDGKTIRNRSQAIEKLLLQSLNEQPVETAIILSGGGKRAYKNSMLKCLRSINRKPIIVHTINRLNEAGIENIIISSNDEEKIRPFLERNGLDARFEEDKGYGTAGTVKKLMNGRTMVISGDVYFELNLRRMIAFHIHSGKKATILVTTTTIEKSKDAIEVEGNLITKFSYKPKSRSYLVNAGVYILEESLKNILPSRGSLESKLFPILARRGELAAFHFSGRWFHVD